MNKEHMTTWQEGLPQHEPMAKLNTDVSTDVVIVGGGLAGTLTAYVLARSGKKVIVLEKQSIFHSTTAYTTAFLEQVVDTDLVDLISMYGVSGAKKIWQSHREAIDLIEKIAKEEHIECDFKRVSAYRFSHSKKENDRLKEEFSAAKDLGFDVVMHNGKHLSFDNYGAMEIRQQAKFHPLKFLIGLRKAAIQKGVQIFDNTEALDIVEKNSVSVLTRYGTVTADQGIIATYQPFKNPKELFAHKGMYISYILEAQIPKGKIPEGLYEDEQNPYHYFRVDAGEVHDRLLIGGEDHRKEIPGMKNKSFEALEQYLAELLPDAHYTIVKRWSGPILETIDGLAYIGRFSAQTPRLMVATGFSGNGMTYSAIAAQVLTDIILGNENPYAELYQAGRKTRSYNFFKKFIDFTEEFFGGAVKNIFK